MPISSRVGRGTSVMDLTLKPPCSSRRRYSATRDLGRIAAMQRTYGPDRRGDRCHIAMTAELADEAATGLKRAMHTRSRALAGASSAVPHW
jgi:hypothetical protein